MKLIEYIEDFIWNQISDYWLKSKIEYRDTDDEWTEYYDVWIYDYDIEIWWINLRIYKNSFINIEIEILEDEWEEIDTNDKYDIFWIRLLFELLNKYKELWVEKKD
jgi:hypothetical protein